MTRRALSLAGALAFLALTVAHAQATSTRRFRVEDVGLSIAIPPGWVQQNAGTGWKFKAAVPTTGTALFLNSFPSYAEKNTFHDDLTAFERKSALAQDPKAKVTVHHRRVAGVRAIEITARYNGLTAHLYGFSHGGVDYTLEWIAKTPLLSRAAPVFAAGLRSLRFLST